MSSQTSQALIQKLLQAEQEAEQIVARARENRSKRLREARSAADEEIAAFRAREDERFATEQAAHAHTADDQAVRDAENAVAIAAVKAAAKKNSGKTVEY
jgi:V-type H+-transporting ATPase subunit G